LMHVLLRDELPAKKTITLRIRHANTLQPVV